jgi:hypothetical protein
MVAGMAGTVLERDVLDRYVNDDGGDHIRHPSQASTASLTGT